MILIRALGSEVLRDHDILKLRSPASVLSGRTLRDTSVTAFIRSLVWYSKCLKSSYGVTVEQSGVADIASDLLSRRFVQGTVESSCWRYVCITKLICRFLNALRFLKKLGEKAASEDCSTTNEVIEVIHLNSTVLLREDAQGSLLRMEATAAYTPGRRHNPACNGAFFYLYAISLLHELRTMQTTASANRSLSLGDLFFIEIFETKNFSVPVKKTHSCAMMFSLYGPAEKKETLAARAKALAQSVFCAARKRFGLREEMSTPARKADRSLQPSTSIDSHWLGKRTTARLSQLSPGLGSRTFPQKKHAPVPLMKVIQS